MTKVLLVTGDPIGDRMAGPAIRAWNIATVLAQNNEVILLTTSRLEADLQSVFKLVAVKAGDEKKFRPFEKWAEVIIFQGYAMARFASLRDSQKVLVSDLYDPIHLEILEYGRELFHSTWRMKVETATDVVNQQLERCDFFLCSSETQRLFYLGQLAALGRINPATYEQDPNLRNLIAVAPFGMPETGPRHERTALRGVVPSIGTNDKVLIWGGGIYNWFDPKSLIEAVAKLKESHENIRLYFLGTKHPGVETMGIVYESIELARKLQVLEKNVFFNESWVEYLDRQNYLTEADAGVSTHFSNLETTFSFRTRILDYLWTGLPMVVTEGDHFAELVKEHALGLVVPPEDVQALADAIETVLFDESFRSTCQANVKRIAVEFTWKHTLAPLVRFVAHPKHAKDFSNERVSRFVRRKQADPKFGRMHDLKLTFHHIRNFGLKHTLEKIKSRL